MQRDGELLKIRDKLFNDNASVVWKPMNNITIENPDVLVLTKDNKLIGLFEPSKQENENPDDLIRRHYMCRLSYVKEMRTILITTGEDHISKNIKKTFDACLEITNNFQKCLDDCPKKKTTVFKETYKNAYARYYKILDFYQKVAKDYQDYNDFIGKTLRQVREYRNSYYKEKDREIKNLYRWGEMLLCDRMKKKSSFRNDFAGIMTNVMRYSVIIDDDGKFYDKSNTILPICVANSEWNRFVAHDLNHSINIKSQALLGILPIMTNSIENLKELIEMYKHLD